MKNYGPILATVIIGLTAWGFFHTVGAYQGADPDDVDIRRSLVVAVSFALFMGFWGLMLWLRSIKLQEEEQKRERDSDTSQL
jgi:hypothetical protein